MIEPLPPKHQQRFRYPCRRQSMTARRCIPRRPGVTRWLGRRPAVLPLDLVEQSLRVGTTHHTTLTNRQLSPTSPSPTVTSTNRSPPAAHEDNLAASRSPPMPSRTVERTGTRNGLGPALRPRRQWACPGRSSTSGGRLRSHTWRTRKRQNGTFGQDRCKASSKPRSAASPLPGPPRGGGRAGR